MRNLEHCIWKYLFRFVRCCIYHQDCVVGLPVWKAAEVSGNSELIAATSKNSSFMCCCLVGNAGVFSARISGY